MSFYFSPLQSASPIITRIGDALIIESSTTFSSSGTVDLVGSFSKIESLEIISSTSVANIVSSFNQSEIGEILTSAGAVLISGIGAIYEDAEVLSGNFFNTVIVYPETIEDLGNWKSANGIPLLTSLSDANNSTYSYSDFDPSTDELRMKMPKPANSHPITNTTITYSYRKLENFQGSLNLTVYLYEGNTEIKNWVTVVDAATINTATQDLTPSEVSSITDFSNLYLKFSASKVI